MIDLKTIIQALKTCADPELSCQDCPFNKDCGKHMLGAVSTLERVEERLHSGFPISITFDKDELHRMLDEAMDEFIYLGKSFREWINIINALDRKAFTALVDAEVNNHDEPPTNKP